MKILLHKIIRASVSEPHTCGENGKLSICLLASVSEPHTSELNRDFCYYYYLSYVVSYVSDALI